MLLKGMTEVAAAGRPLAAAEMVLVRIAYAADLPTPEDVIRSLDENGQASRVQAPAPAAAPAAAASPPRFEAPRFEASRVETSRGGPRAALAPSSDPSACLPASAAEPSAPALVVGRFEDLIALAAQKRDLGVKLALERDVRLVRCEDGRLEIGLQQSAAKTLVNDLARKFSQWTNRRWMVVVSAEQGEATVKSQNETRQAELKTGVRADPLVQAVLARFPGAEIVDVRKGEMPLVPPPDDAGDGPELASDEGRSGFEDYGRAADAEDDL
jgi:DNA polymerase III subunit gamma/tau